MSKKVINIYGGGAATIFFLARMRDQESYTFNVYTNKSTLGRKFLVAGKGGFNLTNDCPPEKLPPYYLPQAILQDKLKTYDNKEFVDFLTRIGIPTYTGSSRRIFPKKGMKPIEVLQAFKDYFPAGTNINFDCDFVGFAPKGVRVKSADEERIVEADFHVFALGGASWTITGSKGEWLKAFHEIDVKTHPFQPANCGLELPDSYADFCNDHQGEAIKNISISYNDQVILGEFNITATGLEGNAIYPISTLLARDSREKELETHTVFIDLKPQWSEEKLAEKLKFRSDTLSKILRQLKFSKSAISLLKATVPKEHWNVDMIGFYLKKLPISFASFRPIDEAISSSGGIDVGEVDDNFELKKRPNTFCIGEMIDWDTRTGGFLLQACYSMAAHLASFLSKVDESE